MLDLTDIETIRRIVREVVLEVVREELARQPQTQHIVHTHYKGGEGIGI